MYYMWMDLQKALSMKISPGICLPISHKDQYSVITIPCCQHKTRSKMKDEAPIAFCQKRQARLSCMSVLENLLQISLANLVFIIHICGSSVNHSKVALRPLH